MIAYVVLFLLEIVLYFYLSQHIFSGRLLTKQVPGFSLAVEARCFVGLMISNQRRRDSVSYLPDQQQHTCIGASEAEHGVEVDQQVGEPHGGAQVVEEMSCSETNPSAG